MTQETLQLCLEIFGNELNQAEATIRFIEHQLDQPQEYRVYDKDEEEAAKELAEQKKWRKALTEAIDDLRTKTP